MASQNQVQEVQQQIEAVVGEVSEVKTSLVAAEEAADGDKVRFLRNLLEQLYRKEVVLREEKNKLMDIQSGGQHCFLVSPPPCRITPCCVDSPTSCHRYRLTSGVIAEVADCECAVY